MSLLGTELPLVQAPMAGVQDSALAIAVCEAGGLGSLPCAMLDAAEIAGEVAAIRSATDRPFNLNFFCHEEPETTDDSAWRALLEPYYAELGLDPGAAASPSRRRPFDAVSADLIEELRPPVVSFHFGLPAPGLLARVKATGATVLSSATTVAEARWLEAHGADAVIAQGSEAGGHRGMFLSLDVAAQVGTFALVRGIAAAIDVPVIAAGGIADAAGVRAAFALGAAAAQVGTAYLFCPEATTRPVHRAALASPGDTVLTNVLTGRPARGIVNRAMRELGPLSAAAPAFPLAANAIAPLRAAAEARGLGDFSSLWCGQNALNCREIPAAELTRKLAEGVSGS